MKHSLHRDHGFATIIFTLMVMLLISIVVFSLLFLSMYEYQSILNYSRYEQAYYLALGAQEEAMSRLSVDWEYTASTPWMQLDQGEYRYQIVDLSPTKKRIISHGRTSTIIRKFECVIEIPSRQFTFKQFINYSLFCSSDTRVEDLGKITQSDKINSGIIGVGQDLTIGSITGGSCPIDVKGNIFINHSSKDLFFKTFLQVDSNLPKIEEFDSDQYINWLQDQYEDLVHTITCKDENDFILEQSSNPTEADIWDICIIKEVDNLKIENLDFDGLLILDDIKEIQIANSTDIKGMIIVFGDKTDDLCIHGNITGNISVINFGGMAYFDGLLVYDIAILQRILPFLSYKHTNNSTIVDLNMVEWYELE